MKLKRIAAVLLASVMTVSLVGCGSTKSDDKPTSSADKPAVTQEASGDSTTPEAAKTPEGKLVVWTLAADLQQFSDYFMEKNPGVEVETVVIAPADYPTKVQSALLGGEKDTKSHQLPDYTCRLLL